MCTVNTRLYDYRLGLSFNEVINFSLLKHDVTTETMSGKLWQSKDSKLMLNGRKRAPPHCSSLL